MARVFCLLFWVTFCFAIFAGGDEKFEDFKAHLRKTRPTISVNVSEAHLNAVTNFARAIRHRKIEHVADFLSNSDEPLFRQALSHVYEFPKRVIARASALQLAVFSGDPRIVRAILDIAEQESDLAALVLSHDDNGQTPMNMAVYLGEIDVVAEFVEFVHRNPKLKWLICGPNRDGQTPLDTALRHKRHDIATLLLSRYLNLPVVHSVAYNVVVRLLWLLESARPVNR